MKEQIQTLREQALQELQTSQQQAQAWRDRGIAAEAQLKLLTQLEEINAVEEVEQ